MEEDCGSWFPQQQYNWQSPYLNSLTATSFGHQNMVPELMNPGTNMVSTPGTLPVYMNAELPHLQGNQLNEPRGWFYCLPRFRQTFTSASNPMFNEHLLSSAHDNLKEATAPKAGTGCAQKRFLVFDQSGDQTTMMFSPAFGSPVKYPNSCSPKALGAYDLNRDPISKGDLNLLQGQLSPDPLYGIGDDNESEMHEDTEELNALLYSDGDSDYTEDDEVTSTGHSPSTMTAHNEQFERDAEEVASSDRSTRKRKLFDGSSDYAPLLTDTASSGNLKPKLSSEYEDDAESSCANGKITESGYLSSSAGNKRLRKGKIRETVNLLRNIIPDGEGKDAITVLDEAIGYLKSLRLKAKDLGLGTT